MLDLADNTSFSSTFDGLSGVAQYYGDESKPTVKGKDAQYKIWNVSGNSPDWTWQEKGN